MRHFSCALVAALLFAAAAQAESIYGLTNLQELVIFDSDARTVASTTPLIGFGVTGETLLTIDVRPATGELFGLSNQSNLYVINPLTGTSMLVGTLSPAPTGTFRAIDFNPTVDRIRVLSSGTTFNNLRVDPTNAMVSVDRNLGFDGGDPNAGEIPFVVSGGYTNSFTGSTSTTLFDIEAGNDVLVTQNPANDGTLQTVGSLGFNITDNGGFTGFDISGLTGNAYLVGNNTTARGGLTANTLYQVDLSSGAASQLGAVSGVNGTFRDIAVVSIAPEPSTMAMAGCALFAGLFFLWRRRARCSAATA